RVPAARDRESSPSGGQTCPLAGRGSASQRVPPGRMPGRHREYNEYRLSESTQERNAMSRENVLVSAEWAEQNLDTDGVVFVEVDEDTSAYDTGHIPGA